MSGAAARDIVALATHARHVPAPERELFAKHLQGELDGRAVVLHTCHRVEAYATGVDSPRIRELTASLPRGGRVLTGEAAIRHAIAVAVGRDSVVVGEDQVLHQLRASVDAARLDGGFDPALERLFALALHAGRRARSWRNSSARSLADVAIAAIEAQAGSLRGRDLLVVGAGQMGRLAARAAAAAGASVSVANRTPEGARALAATVGGHVEALDPGERTGLFGGAIVALGGPWQIGMDAIDALAASRTVVVDLSVPTAVPDAAARALGPRFISADAVVGAYGERQPSEARALARLDELVDRATSEFLGWLHGSDGRAAADALIRHADREREAELAALWRRLPDLQPDARDAIEGMTRHLARRLLREPLERLGRDADGREERAVRDLFAL